MLVDWNWYNWTFELFILVQKCAFKMIPPLSQFSPNHTFSKKSLPPTLPSCAPILNDFRGLVISYILFHFPKNQYWTHQKLKINVKRATSNVWKVIHSVKKSLKSPLFISLQEYMTKNDNNTKWLKLYLSLEEYPMVVKISMYVKKWRTLF